MQKWLLSANTENWNHVAFFAENGFIDWKKKFNYEIGDIVYIYCTKPVAKVMFKTRVGEISSHKNTDKDWVNFHLIEYTYNEDLSLKNLKEHGLKNPPMGAMKLNGDLEKYIDECFENDSKVYEKNPKMWIINAGEGSIKLKTFLENNFVGIGSPFVNLKGKSKDEIRLLCEEENEGTGNCKYKANSFVNEIKFGDFIISKDTSNKEYYIGKCSSDYYYSENMDNSKDDIQYMHCRDVVWLDTPIKRDDLSDECLKYIDQKKSLQELHDENTKNEILNFYNFNFLSNEKRNLIYFGAPGTGKSHNLNNHVETFLKKYVDNIENNYERVTFHPDYTYSNFVGTYKPVSPQEDSKDENAAKKDPIIYKFVPGPFMRILVKALRNPYEPFILIVEEINRANIAAVFGDVFQLLDRNELFNSKFSINASEDMKKYVRSELYFQNIPEYRFNTLENHLKLLFGENFEKISIPSNMFIWATMNSADQGVFPMDTAFKRRWDFKYISINEGKSDLKDIKVSLNDKEVSWNDIREAINDELISYNINEDKLMGPFFAFKDLNENLSPDKLKLEFKEIFKNKIIMYLFEDVARARRPQLFQGVKNTKKENITYYQICEAFDEIELKIFSDNIQKELGIR